MVRNCPARTGLFCGRFNRATISSMTPQPLCRHARHSPRQPATMAFQTGIFRCCRTVHRNAWQWRAVCIAEVHGHSSCASSALLSSLRKEARLPKLPYMSCSKPNRMKSPGRLSRRAALWSRSMYSRSLRYVTTRCVRLGLSAITVDLWFRWLVLFWPGSHFRRLAQVRITWRMCVHGSWLPAPGLTETSGARP